MPYFPDNIYQHRNIENKEGVQYDPSKSKILFAEDLKNIIDEIKKIEEILGLQINKGYDTVKEKIERGHIFQVQRERSDWLTLSSDWQMIEGFKWLTEGFGNLFPNYQDIEFHIYTISNFYDKFTTIETRLATYAKWEGVWQWKRFSLQYSPKTTYKHGLVLCYWGMRKFSEIQEQGLDIIAVEQRHTQGTGKYLSTIIAMKPVY